MALGASGLDTACFIRLQASGFRLQAALMTLFDRRQRVQTRIRALPRLMEFVQIAHGFLLADPRTVLMGAACSDRAAGFRAMALAP